VSFAILDVIQPHFFTLWPRKLFLSDIVVHFNDVCILSDLFNV